MRQLDAGKLDGCGPERLEPQHELAAPFDGPVILLHDVVQVPVGSNQHKLPLGILPTQQAQIFVAWSVTVS
jgi:hypothetical protein